MELIRNSYETYTVLPQSDAQKEVSAEVIVPDTQADVYSVLTAFAACQIKQRLDCHIDINGNRIVGHHIL